MRRYPRCWRLFVAALLLSPDVAAGGENERTSRQTKGKKNEGLLQQQQQQQQRNGRRLRVPSASSVADEAAAMNPEQLQRSALSRTAEPPPYYTCPPSYESPPVLVRNNSTIRLARSEPDSLCTLVRVTFSSAGIGDGYTREDQVGRNALAPVGRSYHALPWERVAGPYRSTVRYVCTEDNNDATSNNDERLCQVTLPPLGSDQEFVLLSYNNHTLSQRNTVARFLQQTTFGPTKAEIDGWDYSAAGDDAFANWIYEQMYAVPLTSHREFWRRRIRQRFERAAPIGRPSHPCEPHSRWREVAFSEWDFGRTVTMRPLVASAYGTNAPYVLYVGGQLRTVAQNVRFAEPSYGIDISHGYEVCDIPEVRVGGRLMLRQPPPDRSCRELYGGNMRLALDDDVITTTPDIVVLDLPSPGDASTGLPGLVRDDERAGWIFAHGIQDQIDKCNGIPVSGSVAPVFGALPSSNVGSAKSFLLHDPHLFLSDNTPDSPLSDGGGELSQATGGLMMCSNAPQTFVNAEGCRLSDEPFTCTADNANAPNIELTLNHEAVVRLSKMSGRYVYVIDGLRVEIGDVLSPCVEGSRSRWMRMDEPPSLCGVDLILAPTTVSVLSSLLSTSKDENPFLLDVYFPEGSGESCDVGDVSAIGMELFVDGTCFKHVHPDHFGVYDFSYWSGEKAHPGNAVRKQASLPNPIKAFLDISSSSILYFPGHHTMDRWSTFKPDFLYVGRYGDEINFQDLSDGLRISAVAEGFGGVTETDTTIPKLVCGSSGEVSNDPSIRAEGFDVSFDRELDLYTDSHYVQQRKTVWTSVVLTSQDQLRQRVAWALSQILVVTTFDIEAKRNSEVFLTFYDIFVRGPNYADILKRVAYSPLMGEMLTYMNSKSSAYVWEEERRRVFADENMAREVLQLFTTGLVHLNLDGTPKLNGYGERVPVYTQEDILSYARGWTGFRRRRKRSNFEDFKSGTYVNKIDPMELVPKWRDARPKTDLSGGFIGDTYPLCVNLPEKMFLRGGARYKLIGGSTLPQYHKELELEVDNASPKILQLDSTSSLLHEKLCSVSGSGECTYPDEVVLKKAVDCHGPECLVDTPRLVELAEGLVYEYVPQTCVELSFFDVGKVVRSRKGEVNVCADPRLPVAGSACCPGDSNRAGWECTYTGELLTHQSALTRCAGSVQEVCSFSKVPSSSCDECCVEGGFLWTNDACRLQIKVSRSGYIAMVHATGTGDLEQDATSGGIPSHLSIDTTEYFRVFWDNDSFPSADNGCGENGNPGFCRPLNGNECLCDIEVVEEQGFYSMPTKEQALSELFIGHIDPSIYGNGTYVEERQNDIVAYHSLSTGPGIGPDSVFLVDDEFKGRLLLKNTISSIRVGTSAGSFAFRNPPQFLSSFNPQPNEAMSETDAILNSYLYHQNTAPFLATRFIQRFGISNPSPRFVSVVAKAFRAGTYTYNSAGKQVVVFGDGQYSSMAATIAAILLDRESRTAILDLDPSHGALKEPILFMLGFMRSMQYKSNPGHELVKLYDVQDRIGQMAYESPTVFSFMLPHYSPVGPVADAQLFAPEAQLLAMSSVVASLNGLFSLINFGLTSCDYGFGSRPLQGCSRLYEGDYSRSQGRLYYRRPVATTAEGIIDELSTLLTAGRLDENSRGVIIDMYERESDKEAALRMAQQLLVTTPEYASTSATPKSIGVERKAADVASTCRPYKAVVLIMLEGACDSQNMLVPHSGCEDRIGKDLYTEYSTVRNYLSIDRDDLLPIQANDMAQPCSTFGLHPQLKGLHQLYSEESALFLANVGMLPRPFTDASHVRGLKMNLYSHEHMQSEVKKVDAYRNYSGTGINGRLADVMRRSGMKTGSVALDEVSEASTGRIARPMVVNEKNIERFAPMSTSGIFKAAVRRLNDATSWQSSFSGETWSRVITNSLTENSLIYNTLANSETAVEFSKDSISRQLETVARLISTRRCRGVEREVFYVKSGGWDTHDDMNRRLGKNFEELDESLTSFVKELKDLGMFEDVVMVMHSDFGRTLTPNSRGGSDHGWGGNSFVIGGAVKGGRIIGKYPGDLTDSGPLNLGRGRVLPTTSYESVWNAIALWFGVKEDDLGEVLPNRQSFAGNLFSLEDIFHNGEDANSTKTNGETCSVEQLQKTCRYDDDEDGWTPYGRAGRYGGYGNSGITNMAAFLLLIVGIIALCGIATCCWRRSAEKRRREAFAPPGVIL